MPRKNTKSSSAKPKNNSKTQISILKLEKDFMNGPAQLAAQFAKEIASLKQSESKLQAAIDKTNMQLQKTSTGAKAKSSMKLLKELMKQHNENTKSLEIFTKKHAKMIALRKTLNQFDKDWTKTSKITKEKNVLKSQQKKSSPKLTQTAPIIPLEQPHVETCETSCDNAQAVGLND